MTPQSKKRAKPISKKRYASPPRSSPHARDQRPKTTPPKHLRELKQRALEAQERADAARVEAEKLHAKLERANRKIKEPTRRVRTPKDQRRRAEYDEEYAEQLHEAKNAARRAKRKAQKQADETRHKIQSNAAKKGWETRRRKPLEADFVARTEAQRDEVQKAKRRKKSKLSFDFVPDAVKFATADLKYNDLVELVLSFKDSGVKAMRFVREVPPSPDYPTGVVSSRWMNIQKSTDQQLRWLIGGMMQPGVDFVRSFYTIMEETPLLPKPIRDGVIAALER